MKRFADLYARIDSTNKTSEKIAAMAAYFAEAPPEDAVWVVALFTGRRPKRVINSTRMQLLAAELADVPLWLFGECYDAVGDLGETIALILDEVETESADLPLHKWLEELLPDLATSDEETQKVRLAEYWRKLNRNERFVLNKIIGGAFRVGVSQELVIRALAQASGLEAPTVAHRLMGNWQPTPDFFRSLSAPEDDLASESRPYPFCLAHPLESSIEDLGAPGEWIAEWKWDGIRAQLVRRNGSSYIWSRGEELITDRFPEVSAIADRLPNGTVLDGEVLGWNGDKPLKFLELQKRIGRKSITQRLLQEVPVRFVAFDVLEWEGHDLREKALRYRREVLGSISDLDIPNLMSSPAVPFAEWEDLMALRLGARDQNVEGLMLKRSDSPYLVGRKKGLWWKWKIDPLTVDAVLMYAARGSGKRASLYTDYTFGVWDGDKLVPFAKAYSGLTDAEIRQVDSWVRRNTLEKFGPVRTVTPELVFELAFEAIQPSSRHKSGVAVRFPRILRWRHDKKMDEADRLESIKESLLIEGH
jgi:DNA ligase-1